MSENSPSSKQPPLGATELSADGLLTICCLQLTYHPCKTGMHNTSFYSTETQLKYVFGRLIFIHLQCREVLPFCRFQRQRCIKILCPKDPDFYIPLALKTAKGQQLPAPEVYKNQSPSVLRAPVVCLSETPNPPEFAQPRLSRVKGWSSPAKGYKFGCVCSYMAGVISHQRNDWPYRNKHTQICTLSLGMTTP